MTDVPAAPPPPFRCGQIAIVGRPNVGKSTLLNRLIGQKLSIVSRKAQTTRARVRGVLTNESAQFVFVDTPGFQTEHRSAMNDMMNRTVKQTFDEVDLTLFVVQVDSFSVRDRAVLDLVPLDQPTIVVINMIDRLQDQAELLPFIERLAAAREFTAIVPVSAERGTRIPTLLKEIASHLPEGPRLFDEDALTDRSERFLAAERIREKLFRHLGEELPYSLTVVIEKFEQEGRLRRIFATILTDHENHKPIILGKAGERIKRIASDARVDMQKLFDAPVYLEVFVKVRSGWAETEASLRQHGFEG